MKMKMEIWQNGQSEIFDKDEKIPFCQSGKIFFDPYSERIVSVHFCKTRFGEDRR
jgi:hypothetical protein